MAARSLAGLTITPTGTSTSKISCSRLPNVNADNESPPRSVKCASGDRSAGRRAEQRARGPADRLQHRRVGAAAAQLAQLVGLAVGQVDVELFQALAVVLLELRPRQLADAGQQTVLQRERRCLDEEVARNLVGLQAGLFGDVLQRVGDHRLERVGAIALASASSVGTTTASR